MVFKLHCNIEPKDEIMVNHGSWDGNGNLMIYVWSYNKALSNSVQLDVDKVIELRNHLNELLEGL